MPYILGEVILESKRRHVSNTHMSPKTMPRKSAPYVLSKAGSSGFPTNDWGMIRAAGDMAVRGLVSGNVDSLRRVYVGRLSVQDDWRSFEIWHINGQDVSCEKWRQTAPLITLQHCPERIALTRGR